MFAGKLLTGATFVGLVVAQAKIAFTSVPAVVRAGDSYNITWGGGNGTPVTLTLRKGDPTDLDTVEVIADGIKENSYEWKVDEDLYTANDYALQITQGQNEINYSGQFALSGGRGSSSIPYTATSTTSENATSSTTSEGSRTTNGTMTSTNTANSTESTTTTESGTSTTESSTRSSRTSNIPTQSAIATSAPNSDQSGANALQCGSSIAFGLAVFAAVVFFN